VIFQESVGSITAPARDETVQGPNPSSHDREDWREKKKTNGESLKERSVRSGGRTSERVREQQPKEKG